jgi:TIR domain/AAA ATPase domain
MSKPFSHLFLSYSSADENIACELKVYLEKRIRDLEVFMAARSIQRGEDWERRVHSSLKESFAFVPIITKDWQKSRWCFGEWVAACVLGEIILPFVETTVELRSELGRIQHIRFRKEQPEFEKLAEDIDRIFSQHTAKRDFNKSPFPYAFRYESDDAHLFRGRDKEVDTIVSQLNAMRHSYDNRALILHGSSGAGKSSLVRAGLYPKLARTSNFWIVTELFKTEDKPVDVLLDRLYHSLTSADVTAKYAARAIKGIRSATEEKLAGALEGVTALLDGKSLVLIVDNLDRYCNHDTPQSKRLLVLLRAAIRTRSIKVIGVLRTDQLPRVAKALDISAFEYDSICIIRPDPETLISSMNEVLSEKGYAFDRDLIHTIYVDAGASMEAWRLIGRCLNDLWTTAEDKATAFQLTNYRKKGGIGGQIQNDLATVETGLDTEIENFFDFLAVEGVSHLEGQTVVSRPIPVARIHSDHKHAIDLLVEKGLIVAGNKDATGEAVIEIVPAVIEKYWSRARIVSRVNALEELLEARRAADQWKLKGHQIEWLVHRGKRLSHVKNLIERRRLAYSEMGVYLEECERHFHS